MKAKERELLYTLSSSSSLGNNNEENSYFQATNLCTSPYALSTTTSTINNNYHLGEHTSLLCFRVAHIPHFLNMIPRQKQRAETTNLPS